MRAGERMRQQSETAKRLSSHKALDEALDRSAPLPPCGASYIATTGRHSARAFACIAAEKELERVAERAAQELQKLCESIVARAATRQAGFKHELAAREKQRKEKGRRPLRPVPTAQPTPLRLLLTRGAQHRRG